MELKLLVFITTLVCNPVNIIYGANILAVMPLPFASHFKTYQPLLEEIVKVGHNFTLISSFHLNSQFQPNYKWVNVSEYGKCDADKIIPEMLKHNRLKNFLFAYEIGSIISENILNSSEVQEIIQSKGNYDLIIAEMFSTDAFFAFGRKFNAPVISLTSQQLSSTHNWMIGNPFPSSYVPNPFLPMTEKMSVISRIINTGFNFISIVHYEFVGMIKVQTMIEKYFHFEEGNVPHIKDIMKNISVTFVNAHHSFGYAKPNLPNVVNIAGIHFTPLKPLPEKIQKFMDGAKHGVIYLSLGSIVTPSSMKFLGEILINCMKNLPHRVLMKWDPKLLKHIPDNVLVNKWFPQADILHHPNCRLFITHGGFLGLLESLNASVPVIVLPFFGDQFYNMVMVEYFEIGMPLTLEEIPDQLTAKISHILKNSKYKKNVEERSRMFRNRLTRPLDTAVYWIDHVLERPYTSYLHAASAQLTWFELYSLDVMAILGIFILSIIYTMKFVILWLNAKVSFKKQIKNMDEKYKRQ